jgi:hypothetical protein
VSDSGRREREEVRGEAHVSLRIICSPRYDGKEEDGDERRRHFVCERNGGRSIYSQEPWCKRTGKSHTQKKKEEKREGREKWR